MSKNVDYEDWDAIDGFVQYPEALFIGDGRVLVSTYHGSCYVVDTNRLSIRESTFCAGEYPEHRIGHLLQSLSSARHCPGRFAVATQAGWACLWELDSDSPAYIHPEAYGSVNAVALSPNGNQLAIGTGYYVLNPHGDSMAMVELWDLEASEARCVASIRLPGIVVDRLAWAPDESMLVAVTGARTQDRGHLAILNPRHLAIAEITETTSPMCRKIHVDPVADRIVLLLRGQIEVRSASNPWEVHHVEKSANRIRDFDVTTEDSSLVVLTDGRVLSLEGDLDRQLTPLEECTTVVSLPDGRIVGVSGKGVVRIWRAQ